MNFLQKRSLRTLAAGLLLCLSATFAACGGGGGGGGAGGGGGTGGGGGGPVAGTPTIDDQVRDLIVAEGLTGDPSTGRGLPSINDPLAQLGKLLFFFEKPQW